MTVICQIYRSPKHEGMYLYTNKSEGVSRVPEALLERFGTPQAALVLALTAERKLARVEVTSVLESLQSQGYYLQLPPPPEQNDEIEQVRRHNSKLAG